MKMYSTALINMATKQNYNTSIMKINIFYTSLFVLLGTVTAFSINPAAESAADSLNIFEYFYQMEKTPTIRLDMDMGKLIKTKLNEEEQEGTMTYVTDDGVEMEFDMTIRARGNIRKQQCYYPPVKIDLKKGQLKDFGFNGLDKIKLVLQCKSNDVGEKYLMKERLIYDMYAILDSFSVRTKLIKVDIYENGELDKSLSAFLIEDEDQYAARVGGRVIESGNVRSSSLQRDHYLRMVFFQYMIGNTDWAIPNKHNVEIVAVKAYPRVIAVPYDFDYAGFVGTNYAVPHESLPIQDVRDHHFQGFQVTKEEANETANFYRPLRQPMYDVINKADYCDDKTKEESIKFIDYFFDLLDNNKKVERTFVTEGK